nr:MAG TPA: hypothetical protein [Caudoviricetes sp.]
MAYGIPPNRPVAKINRLGLADYYCGMCGGVLLRIVSVTDLDTPLPKQCPHCHGLVDRVGRQKKLNVRLHAARPTKNANRAKATREKRLEALVENPHDPKHGTPTGYSYGCRCDECRQAASEYQRDRKKMNK